MIFRTFTLPLPPSTNQAYKIGTRKIKGGWGEMRAMMMKTPKLIAWEEEAAWIVRDWMPPKHTSLKVEIILWLPKNMMRKVDIDGKIKALIDATVGRRRDQWIDCQRIIKVERAGTGQAEVTIDEWGNKEE